MAICKNDLLFSNLTYRGKPLDKKVDKTIKNYYEKKSSFETIINQ